MKNLYIEKNIYISPLVFTFQQPVYDSVWCYYSYITPRSYLALHKKVVSQILLNLASELKTFDCIISQEISF